MSRRSSRKRARGTRPRRGSTRGGRRRAATPSRRPSAPRRASSCRPSIVPSLLRRQRRGSSTGSTGGGWPNTVPRIGISLHSAGHAPFLLRPAAYLFVLYDARRGRSEERRVGKKCVSTGNYRWSRKHSTKKKKY